MWVYFTYFPSQETAPHSRWIHNSIPISYARSFQIPWLWEKHANAILCEIGLTPTVHKPYLYSGVINSHHVFLKQEVDDFPIAAPDAKTANILLDLIVNILIIPVKWQGYLDMYNDIGFQQTGHNIKIFICSFINLVFEKHLLTWINRHSLAPPVQPPYLPIQIGRRSSMPPLEIRTLNCKVNSPKRCNSATAPVLANSFWLWPLADLTLLILVSNSHNLTLVCMKFTTMVWNTHWNTFPTQRMMVYTSGALLPAWNFPKAHSLLL